MGGRGQERHSRCDGSEIRREMSACISLVKPSHHQRFSFKKDCKRERGIPCSNFILLFSFLKGGTDNLTLNDVGFVISEEVLASGPGARLDRSRAFV